MYRLHFAPDNASMIVRLVLEELGVPYDTVLVDRTARAQETSAYRAINPTGAILVLETPDGPVFETAAILLYLAETHGRMAPPVGDPGRGAFLTWMVFASNTVQMMLRMSFYPEKFVGPETQAQAALRDTLMGRHPVNLSLPRALELLDGYFADRIETPEIPTVLDYYAGALVRWCALYPQGHNDWFNLTDYPALHRIADWLEDRPAVHTVQILEGLGPTPFTSPILATPPEGSAL